MKKKKKKHRELAVGVKGPCVQCWCSRGRGCVLKENGASCFCTSFTYVYEDVSVCVCGFFYVPLLDQPERGSDMCLATPITSQRHQGC